MAAGLVHQPHLHPIPRQAALHQNHLAVQAPQADAFPGEVLDPQRPETVVSRPGLLHGACQLPSDLIDLNCKGALHLPHFPCGSRGGVDKIVSSLVAAMSVVRDLILQADDQLRYPTSGELRRMVEFLSGGGRRLEVVRLLTENEKKIVDEAAKQLFTRKPEYVAPGGNAFGQKQRAQCLRDYSWYLRLVTYGVLAGSTDQIQTIGLVGAREMYNSLGVPMPGMVEAMRTMKEAAVSLMSSEDAALAGPYFDFLIQGMQTIT
jgi:allophycocyanin-B